MALRRPEDVDVAEAHTTEVATVVTVASIIMGNVEDIEEATMAGNVEDIEATMAVTVEDTEEGIVEDTVEATVEAREVASEATEVANEVETVVWICPYLIAIRI